MIEKEILQRILEAGVQAPSGSNSQPWRFEVSGDEVLAYMIPEKDHPVLNFRDRGTLFATGCLIENMVIAAGHFGIKASVKIFPDQKEKKLVAKLSFSRGDAVTEALFESIKKRATNRKPYEIRELPHGVLDMIGDIPQELGDGAMAIPLIEDRSKIGLLASAASVNEIVMFENETLHKLFFEELVWTEREEVEKKSGLYLKTMELKPPQAAALKLFRRWPFMRAANRLLRAARGIAKGNASGYAACGAYGAVISENTDEAFVNAGRAVERAWLIATANGLSFHLQTGINFLWMRLVAEGIPGLSEEHTRLIREEYEKIATALGVNEGKIVSALFRIGYGGEPSARSSRRAPEVVYK